MKCEQSKLDGAKNQPCTCKDCKVMELLDEFNRNLLRCLNTTELKYSQDIKAIQESLEAAMIHSKKE